MVATRERDPRAAPVVKQLSVVRRVLANVYACRFFFFVLALMEIADLVSDVLWLLSVVTREAFHKPGEDDDDMVDRYEEATATIYFCTIGFFALSTTLLFGKLFDDLKDIFSSDASKRHPHKRLEVFGLSVFYLLTMSNSEVAAAYHQRSVARDAETANLWDSIAGLHRRDNHLDERYPLLAPVLAPQLSSARNSPTKLWELVAYPIALTFSGAYFRSLPPSLSFLLWPLAAAMSVVSMASMFLIGLGNMFSKSKHSYTIRIFEDIPQLLINIAYLLAPYGKGRANNVSKLSLVLSAIMLLKFALEVAYEACTTEVECQLVRRHVRVQSRPSAAHTLFVCFVSPLVGISLAPLLLLRFVSAGIVAFLGGLCGCTDRVDESEWAPMSEGPDAEAVGVLADPVGEPAIMQEQPLLA